MLKTNEAAAAKCRAASRLYVTLLRWWVAWRGAFHLVELLPGLAAGWKAESVPGLLTTAVTAVSLRECSLADVRVEQLIEAHALRKFLQLGESNHVGYVCI